MTTATKPATGEVILLDGVRTFFVDKGQGQALLLIHGSSPGGDGLFAWSPVLPALAPHCRAIVVDAPGYGDSDMLNVKDTPENVARHLVRLLDHLGVAKTALLGHSRGGRIAVELVSAAPERVTRLGIMCSGSASPGGHVTADGKFTDAATAIVRFGLDGDTSFETYCRARRGSVLDPAKMPDEMLRPAYDKFMATRIDEWIERMRAFDPLTFYHSQDAERFKEKLRAINVPTMVIAGREDRIAPWQKSLPLVEMIQDLEFHLLGNCGHAPQLDRPVELTALLVEFFRRDGSSH